MTCHSLTRSKSPAAAAATALTALLLVLLASACSSRAAATDPTTSSAPSASVPDAPPTSTTTLATTTTPPTTVSTEAAIRAAHTRVMTELFARDERITGPETILPLADELTTGPYLQRIKEVTAAKVASGERSVGPGYDSHIVKVTMVDANHARVLDCSQDRGERYSAAGSLIIRADDFYKLRESEMVLVDGRWLAQELNTGGDQRCTP